MHGIKYHRHVDIYRYFHVFIHRREINQYFHNITKEINKIGKYEQNFINNVNIKSFLIYLQTRIVNLNIFLSSFIFITF